MSSTSLSLAHFIILLLEKLLLSRRLLALHTPLVELHLLLCEFWYFFDINLLLLPRVPFSGLSIFISALICYGFPLALAFPFRAPFIRPSFDISSRVVFIATSILITVQKGLPASVITPEKSTSTSTS